MSNIAERVEQHMNSAALPSMKIVKAGEAEEATGSEGMLVKTEKPSGTRRFFERAVEPEPEPEAQEEASLQEESPQEEVQQSAPPEEEKEEVADAVGNFMDRLGYSNPNRVKENPEPAPEEEKEEPAPEPEPEDSEEVAEPAEQEEKEEESPKAPKKRRRKEGIDADEIKEIIRETAQSVSQQARISEDIPELDTAPPVAASPIEAKNKSDLDVFSEMESDPKYSGIRGRYAEYLTKLSQYKDNWKKENPSSKFSLDDMEHEDFITASQPAYDLDDFTDARITVKARSLIAEQERSYRHELEELRSSVDEGNMKEELQTASNASIAEVVKLADESYLKVVQDGGGDALKDADPVAHDVLNEVLAQNEKALYELEKLTHPTKKFRLNTSNDTHKLLVDFAIQKEGDIAKLPVSEQMHEGRRFATTKQWSKMGEAQRANHWHLEPSHIKAMYISDVGNQAKERIEKQRAVFDKYLKHKAGQKTAPKASDEAKKPQQKRAKTNPPSTTGEAVNATGNNPAASVDIGESNSLKQRLWG